MRPGGVSDFVAALGLMFVFEGLIYALAPAALKRMMARAPEVPDGLFRLGGLAAIAVGVGVVWLVRH